MSDPIGRDVSPGEPLEIAADSFNLMMRAARRERDREFGETGGEYGNNPLSAGARVYVRNDTGGDLAAFAVLKLGTPIMDATDANLVHDLQAAPIFPGTAPAAATDPFAIAVTPIAAGEIAVAVVLGVVVCDIEVSDAAHGYAAPSTFTAKLVSAAAGPAKVIWKDAGTGLKRAMVALCGQGAAAGGALSSGTRTMGGTFAITATSQVWQNVNDGSDVTLTLPAAGTYLVFGQATADLSDTNRSTISVRLYNSTDATPVQGTGVVCVTCPGGVEEWGSGSFVEVLTVAASKTLTLQAMWWGTSAATKSILYGNPPVGSSTGGSGIRYVKIG